MCRDCINAPYYKATGADPLHIEITYDIVIKNFWGNIVKTMHTGYNWNKTSQFFQELNAGAIQLNDYTSDLPNNCKYTVETIVNNDLYEFK